MKVVVARIRRARSGGMEARGSVGGGGRDFEYGLDFGRRNAHTAARPGVRRISHVESVRSLIPFSERVKHSLLSFLTEGRSEGSVRFHFIWMRGGEKA